jgi:hypothetical protein
MKQVQKKQYVKPRLQTHGSVEELTGYIGGGCGEFLGGSQGTNNWLACKVNGPADFGS